MKRPTIGHSKFARLTKALRMPKNQAIGILEGLWHLCAKETPRGNIGKLTGEAIGVWLEYHGDPQRLMEALADAGWLDRSKKYRYVVHDWHEHADDAVKKYVARHKLTFADLEEEEEEVEKEPDSSGPVPPSSDVSRHVPTCLDRQKPVASSQ